jgi:hypothetical protein
MAEQGDAQEGLAMLEAFANAGAERFDVTLTSCHGEKLRFRRGVSVPEFRRTLPLQIADAVRRQENVIVRPRSSSVAFIQLDDLNEADLGRVTPAAFLSLQTSPGNFQAWVALLAKEVGDDLARRLRKGCHADDTASGATRVAGSLNFKDKYAPDFPKVELHHTSPGLIASREQLDALGLIAPAEQRSFVPYVVPKAFRSRSSNRGWPSYDVCLQGAPPARDGHGPDISRADFTWCMTASSWGKPIEAIAERLMALSPKAKENGERYAQLTAQNAAAAAERNARTRS